MILVTFYFNLWNCSAVCVLRIRRGEKCVGTLSSIQSKFFDLYFVVFLTSMKSSSSLETRTPGWTPGWMILMFSDQIRCCKEWTAVGVDSSVFGKCKYYSCMNVCRLILRDYWQVRWHYSVCIGLSGSLCHEHGESREFFSRSDGPLWDNNIIWALSCCHHLCIHSGAISCSETAWIFIAGGMYRLMIESWFVASLQLLCYEV